MPRRSHRRPFREHLPFAPQADPLFRWRGTGVSRLEGLADAVFAFTVTLLVVALEVPRDYADLMRVFAGFPAFAATFAMLMWFWTKHYIFFRRYGLEDGWTRFLNILVLLLVVFLAYPLKFLFGSAFAALFGWGEAATGISTLKQLSTIYIVYGAGLGAVWFVYFLLYWHAYRQRESLRLTTAEIILTRSSLTAMLITMLVCLASIALATLNRYEWQPGMVYILFGPALGLNGWWHSSRARKAEAAFQQRRDAAANDRA
jgi:uncharacterized membrane protein